MPSQTAGRDTMYPKADLAGKHKRIANFRRAKFGQTFILPEGQWLLKGVSADYKHLNGQINIIFKPGGFCVWIALWYKENINL